MEETKDETTLPVGSFPAESVTSNPESLPSAVFSKSHEVLKQNMKEEKSVTSDVHNDNSVILSSQQSPNISDQSSTSLETVAKSLSEMNNEEASHSLDIPKLDLPTVSNDPEEGQPACISHVEDTSQSLSFDNHGCRQVNESTPNKSPPSSSSEDQDTSRSPPESTTETSPVVDHIETSSEMKNIGNPESLEIKSVNGDSVGTDLHIIYEEKTTKESELREDSSQALPTDKIETQIHDSGPMKLHTSTKASTEAEIIKENKGLVDTAAPFESVKEVVTKFGGIVDWKAHKSKTLERQKYVQSELQVTQEEIPRYKKQAEAAEKAKVQVLEELESTKRLIEELKLSLEKAKTEESQAKQDSELAQLRVKEMEQGIASEASVAAKEQLNVAKSRYAAAVTELKSVKDELKVIQEEYATLISERDLAIARAEEAVSASKDIEKTVEDLTLDLITAREALESAHTAHMEAEEHRIGAALARDQDSLNWEKELKQAEDELQQLNEKISSAKNLQSKLDSASTLLLNLKSELAAYMEAKLNQESESISKDNQEGESAESKETHASILAEVAVTKKELDDVKCKIEKARKEVDILKVAATSLKTELEDERAALATMKQREGMASIAVASLEAELTRTKMEIEQVQMREKEIREQMVEMPKALQEAAREADEAKSLAQSAEEELQRAKEESEQAKASVSTMESRLHAALKEIDATRASEKLALAAINALKESEQASESSHDDSHTGVTLSLEEYYALSKKAHDAEEQAGEKVAAAIAQIQTAKESETRSLETLELAYEELSERREALRLATERAEKAKEGKLAVEQELRAWRAENERRRKAADASSQVVPSLPPRGSFEDSKEPKIHVTDQEAAVDYAQSTASDLTTMHSHQSSIDNDSSEVKAPRKKKSFFPRIVMFLARKRAHSTGAAGT